MVAEQNLITGNEKELAFDLRQVWVKNVGEQLQDLKESKKSNKPFNYYKEIEDLFDLVQQKFNNKNETIERFNNLRKEIIILSNKYKSSWFGNKSGEEISIIENKLREMERFLYDEMESANMFGAKFDDEGL